MEYKEFLEKVAENIKLNLPDNYRNAEVTIQETKKNNNVILNSIMIKNPDNNVSPVFYMEGYYAKYQEGELSIDEIGKKVIEDRIKNEKSIDISAIINPENVRKNVVFNLVGIENNKEMLNNIPHRIQDDMAITYRILVDQENVGETATIKITNDIMDMVHMDENELYELSMNNTPSLMPAKLKNMLEIVSETMGIDAGELFEPGTADAPMYVLTNNQMCNGASTIFYPGIQEEIYNKLQSEYFVLPSSVHEVILVPKDANMEAAELKQMVNEVNSTQVSPEEVLTGNVYEYDAKAKVLTIADNPLYKVNEADIKRSGFKPTKNMVKNMESLNKATGKNNTLQDVKDIMKDNEASDTAKKLANDIAKECRVQEQQLER